jgi:acyl-CoA dehydrogenase
MQTTDPVVGPHASLIGELTETQRDVQTMVDEGMARFPLEYWLECDVSGTFPHEFFAFAAEHDWLGIAMPSEYGGSGLGISEAVVMLEAVARSGGGQTAASTIHMNIFGTNVVVKHGSGELKRRIVEPVLHGNMKVAFGVTEPDAGLDTLSIRTRAERDGDSWRINGHKVWISTAQIADKILLLTRTSTPTAEEPRWFGLTLFLADLDRERIDVRKIRKAGRAAVDSNELFIENLIVNDADRVGEIGMGFRHLLDGLNPERLLVAAEAIGMGRFAIKRAAEYARERVVFGRPIGMNQGVQFPLAEIHARLECAWLMVLRGAALYDVGQSCGAEANIAKLLGAEWGHRACSQAMQTLGGYGYAAEYHVERLWRESKLPCIAPVTPELILAYLSERELGLPKSY